MKRNNHYLAGEVLGTWRRESVMEHVKMEEAQTRLADLLAAAAEGETVIIEAADKARFQLLPLERPDTYLGHDGLLYYRPRGQVLEEQVGVVYYPSRQQPVAEPLQPGSALRLITIADDFEELLDDFHAYMGLSNNR